MESGDIVWIPVMVQAVICKHASGEYDIVIEDTPRVIEIKKKTYIRDGEITRLKAADSLLTEAHDAFGPHLHGANLAWNIRKREKWNKESLDDASRKIDELNQRIMELEGKQLEPIKYISKKDLRWEIDAHIHDYHKV